MKRTTDERQGDLLQLIEQLGRQAPPRQPGSMNVDVQLRGALSEAMRRFPGDRFEVAARMSRLLDVEVTKWQLDAWTATSKDGHRFPASYLPAFCSVLGDWTPMKVLCETGGHRLDTDPDVSIAAELGRLEMEIREAEEQLREKKALRKRATKMFGARRGAR